jgi:hypothetical protein
VPAMFMLMDDIGALFWHFGKKLIVSHPESEQANDHGGDHREPPPPPAIVRSPAAE